MERDVFAGTTVHPNLMLTQCAAQRPICCLVLENAQDAQLRALGLRCVHLYRQGALGVLLFELPSEEEWQELLEKNLLALNLKAGMSGPFALAASAHGCMRKAELALYTGKQIAPRRALYPMNEYGEAALIAAAKDVLAREGFTQEDFSDAAIAQMLKLDARTGTRYARSLHAYLSHGLNMRQAAQALGIHRNTLDYRMRRVQELFALDLQDVNTCFELLFSFWLMDNLPGADGRGESCAPFDAAAAQAALWRHVERCDGNGDEAGAPYACRLLCVGVRRLADAERIALLQAMRCLLPESAACAFDEDVLFFALPPQEMEAFAEACRALCDEKDCRTVITQPFMSDRLMQRLRLCRMALCVSAQRHARTQDMCSALFFMILEQSGSLAPYLCEDVIRVMDEDAVRGTTLSRSLYAYLLNFKDMKRAAEQLHIHRNTMEYQMHKIDALIGRPVGEKQRFLMMCTYKMLAVPDMHRLEL